MSEAPHFHEAKLSDLPMRELGLTIAGTPLESILAEFERELEAVGITRVKPRFYLSTEWGVPFGTIAVAIPFYLARPEFTELHVSRTGLVEGVDREDILRYLRHEMGHVLNYAYRLYDRTDWVNVFGSITQPYEEEYRPEPWSRHYVRHLPGWYAQKHPDEDWAETFAVWMTPGSDYHVEYAAWPGALRKLEFCAALMREIREREPQVICDVLDEDLTDIDYSIDTYYRRSESPRPEFPPGLDGALRAAFAPGEPAGMPGSAPASALIIAQARLLVRAVFTWTGHFPEHTHPLLAHLAERADALGLRYAKRDEQRAMVMLTALVTSLAMNHVHRGTYLP